MGQVMPQVMRQVMNSSPRYGSFHHAPLRTVDRDGEGHKEHEGSDNTQPWMNADMEYLSACAVLSSFSFQFPALSVVEGSLLTIVYGRV